MSQQPVLTRILAGAVTFVGLGIVWVAIVSNLPSQQEELSAKESPPPNVQSVQAQPVPEPVLDLSIPGVPAGPQASEAPPGAKRGEGPPAVTALDPRTAQVARQKVAADLLLHVRRGQHLPAACQQQIRERLVKWKEERSQFKLACQADIRRFCPDLRPGVRQTLQCLQQHAQEVSDGCYEMLPKGTLNFK